jgi:hypothetical protein
MRDELRRIATSRSGTNCAGKAWSREEVHDESACVHAWLRTDRELGAGPWNMQAVHIERSLAAHRHYNRNKPGESLETGGLSS